MNRPPYLDTAEIAWNTFEEETYKKYGEIIDSIQESISKAAYNMQTEISCKPIPPFPVLKIIKNRGYKIELFFDYLIISWATPNKPERTIPNVPQSDREQLNEGL